MSEWSADAVAFVLDAVRDAVVFVDDAGNVDSCNRAATRLLGLATEEVTGRAAGDVLVAADRARVLDRAVGGDPVSGGRASLRRQDGETVHVSVEAASLDDVTVIVLHDESERLETQAILAGVQERLRDLQSLGDVGLWRWVPDEDEVQWSEQLYRIHGLDPLEFAGDLDGHVTAIREDDRDEVRRALRETADHGYPFEEEYVIVRHDGEERTVYSRADPVLNDDGTVAAVTGIIQDVTADRRAREEVEAANQRLERFARALAHDLRTPLVAVTGFAELLVEDEAVVGEVATFAERIRHNSEQALELLNTLLTEARRRETRSTTREIDLQDIVAWAIDTLDEQIERADTTITAEDLPHVHGHEPLLRQALLNLVGNAVKFGGSDGSATVRISANDVDGMVELRVEDNGPGVPEDEREAIFSDGYRVQRDVDRGIDGTGIGLATVREVAESHGTTVTVTDSDLGGACFALRLRPVADEDAEHDGGDELPSATRSGGQPT